MEFLTTVLQEITQTPNWGILLLSAYLLGAIPFGLLITRVFLGYDVRTQGSGNIGMTNVMRTGGKLPGIATFLLDFGKGSIAVWATQEVFQAPVGLVILVSFLAVLGHTRSVFLKFTGGKGVATNLSVWLILDWRIFLVLALTWIVVFLLKKISSLSALLSLLALPVATGIIHGVSPLLFLALLLSLYIIALHHDNIRRLFQGEEKVLQSGKS